MTTEAVAEEPTPELWGLCRVTAYCPCERCCGAWATKRPINPETGEPIVYGADGTELVSGVSVACCLPFGTKLYIPELDTTYEVHDRTSKSIQDKYNGMTVDIYINDHQECFQYLAGHPDYMEVFIVHAD